MKNFILIAALLYLLTPAVAQYDEEDYEKADSIVNHYSGLIYNQVKEVYPVKDASSFMYKTKTAEGIKYVFVDSEKPLKKPVFKDDKFLQGMEEEFGYAFSWEKMSLSKEKIDAKAEVFSFVYKKYNWEYHIKKNKLIKKKAVAKPRPYKHWAIARDELGRDPLKSPDEKYTAYIREYNLWVKENESGKAFKLTSDGSPGEFYSSYISWSPDSKHLAVNKFRTAPKRYMKFMESAPKDQWQPKLKEVEYAKPGDALPVKQPCLFSIDDKKQMDVDFEEYLQQYSLSDPHWRKDSRAFTVEYNQRGHQKYSVLEIAASDGGLKVLAEETPETFFFYSGKRYRYDINDGEEMIWMSERDGWNHLYLYDGAGKVKNQITKGEWVVRNVIEVDEEKRRVLFTAGGINEGEDPYHIHYYTIGFDGQNLKELTTESANHSATLSDDKKYMIDSYSRADDAGKTVLRNVATGELLLTLEEADISQLEATDWVKPEVFTAKGRDGKTDIWGVIYRPSDFDPNKKYPIVEYIYAGPHDSFVPKSFLGVDRRIAALVELGFIGVRIDGMGTSNRSKAFHDVCWKNLKDAGFPDRIKWMEAAAEQYAYMDIERVGIYGGSAGGQSSTGAVLFYPEFYDVAVSSCGCHDNRMDKIWWNEQWMGYPVEAHYDSCSNVVNAHKLEGELMLILGEIDDNVDPASTIQVVDALIKADKEFEFVMLPGMNHTLGGKYGERKRRDFFVKHLLDEGTPVWNH